MKTEKLKAKIARLQVELQDLLDSNPQLAANRTIDTKNKKEDEVLQKGKRNKI